MSEFDTENYRAHSTFEEKLVKRETILPVGSPAAGSHTVLERILFTWSKYFGKLGPLIFRLVLNQEKSDNRRTRTLYSQTISK